MQRLGPLSRIGTPARHDNRADQEEKGRQAKQAGIHPHLEEVIVRMGVGVGPGIALIKRLPKLLIVPKPPAGQGPLFDHIDIGQPDLAAPDIGLKVKDREPPFAHPLPGTDKEQTAHRHPAHHGQYGPAAPYQPIQYERQPVGDPDAAREGEEQGNQHQHPPPDQQQAVRFSEPGRQPPGGDQAQRKEQGMGIGNPGRMQPFYPVAFLTAEPERVEVGRLADQGLGQIEPGEVLYNAVGRHRAGDPERRGQHFFDFPPATDEHKDRQTAAHEPHLPVADKGLQRIGTQNGGDHERAQKNEKGIPQAACGAENGSAPAYSRERPADSPARFAERRWVNSR